VSQAIKLGFAPANVDQESVHESDTINVWDFIQRIAVYRCQSYTFLRNCNDKFLWPVFQG
jgi:hypothetical protein